jgi:hypothetical protein
MNILCSYGRKVLKLILFPGCRDARTREIVYSFEAQTNLAIPEVPVGADLSEEKMLRKEKNMGWLQRSRNALNSAADAVRRAADRLGQEEARRLEALAASEDGTVWGGFGNGLLVQWNYEGNRLREVLVTPVTVKSLLAVGSRLWVGFTNGRIEVIIHLYTLEFSVLFV